MRHQSELNVTPMLDVLLVLLVIFMTVVTGVHRTVDAQLPVPCRAACESSGLPVVLEVLPGPAFRLNHQPVAAGDLTRRLRDVFAVRPQKLLFVAGHAGATYQQVVTAMDVARDAGARVIGLPDRELYRSR